jgi:hypothetical protein
MLAESPADFAACGQIQMSTSSRVAHYTMTNVGLYITLHLLIDRENAVSYALLDSIGSEECCIAIQIDLSPQENIYRRHRTSMPILVSWKLIGITNEETIYIARGYQAENIVHDSSPTFIRISCLPIRDFQVASVHPPIAISFISENGINIYPDAEVVAVHFANNNNKHKFKILLHCQGLLNPGFPEYFLSDIEEHSALESVMLSLSLFLNRIQNKSINPMLLHLHCQFSSTCTYTTTIKAWTSDYCSIAIITEESTYDPMLALSILF